MISFAVIVGPTLGNNCQKHNSCGVKLRLMNVEASLTAAGADNSEVALDLVGLT